MSYLRDIKQSVVTTIEGSNVASITAKLPDNLQQNDLILLFAFKDSTTGGAFTAPSGYTEITLSDNNSPGIQAHAYYKIAGASESNPTVTSTDTDTWMAIAYAIAEVDQTTPIHLTAVDGTVNALSAPFVTATTTNNNCMIIYAIGQNSERAPSFKDGPVVELVSEDNLSMSCATGYSYQTTAGTTPSFDDYIENAVSDRIQILVAINDAGNSKHACHISSSDVVRLDPIYHPTESPFGNSVGILAAGNASAIAATVDGKTVVDNAFLIQGQTGINPLHPVAQVRNDSTIAGLAGERISFAVAKDIDGTNLHFHVGSGRPGKLERQNTASGVGFVVLLADSLGNWAAWQVDAAKTIFGAKSPRPAAIHPDNTMILDSSGTFDPTDLKDIVLLLNKSDETTEEYCHQVVSIGPNGMTFSGGNSDEPLDMINMSIMQLSQRWLGIERQGNNQFLSYMPIRIGDGGTNPLYCNISAMSLEFARESNGADVLNYNSIDNYIGIKINPGSGDVVKITDSIISSVSPYHFEVVPGSAFNALNEVDGVQIIGPGTTTLQPIATYNRVSFDGRGQIDASGCTLTNCTIANPQSGETSALLMTTGTTLTDCTFSTETAADKAIEIAAAGTYALDNVTFTGFTTDITVTATTGTVTINVTNGGDTPTTTTAGATVVINNNVTISIAGNDSGAFIGSRLYLERDDTQAELINEVVTTNPHVALFNYSSDVAVTGRVRRGSSSPYYKTANIAGTITSSGFSATVFQELDE